MAKNSSFRNFGAFSRIINGKAEATFDDNALTNSLTHEAQAFEEQKSTYDKWAESTLLGDVVVPQAGDRKFADLFTQSVGDNGEPVITFNPTGKKGSSWSKNESGFVNALLTAFGTRRYAELRHGYHARAFNRSLVIEHNVLSAYNAELNKWVRYDWNNRRFTSNTPNPKLSAGAGWLSKHIEIDRLILALLGDQSLIYHFFNETAWKRFKMNVLDDLNVLVSNVNVQLSNQAEVAKTITHMEAVDDSKFRDNEPMAVVIDGTDIRGQGSIRVEIKMKYGEHPVPYMIDTNNPARVEFVARTMKDPAFEYIKLA